jgi:hypothetical protein
VLPVVDGAEHELDVRSRQGGIRSPVKCRLGHVRGELAVTPEQPRKQVFGLRRVVERVRGRAPQVHERHRMLLKMSADVRLVDANLDAVLAQMVRRSDP